MIIVSVVILQKISEVVALEKTEVPSSQQLIDAINKQFHNKLSPVEFDEIQLSGRAVAIDSAFLQTSGVKHCIVQHTVL